MHILEIVNKREDLLFSKLLQNFMQILHLFNETDNVGDKIGLGKLRWS